MSNVVGEGQAKVLPRKIPLKVIVEMPYEPYVSVNRAYIRHSRGVSLHHRAGRWKQEFALFFNNARQHLDGDLQPPLRISVGLFPPLGRGRLPDPDNFLKIPIDAVAACLGIDDNVAVVVESKATGYPRSGNPRIVVEVEQVNA